MHRAFSRASGHIGARDPQGMKHKRQIFVALNDAAISHLIGRASNRIVLISPSVSETVAEALVERRRAEPNLGIKLIVDADYDSILLGYGEYAGLKKVHDAGIELWSEPKLRIGVLIVDERSWIYSPTAQIIEEQTISEGVNAIIVGPGFTRRLLASLAPHHLARDLIFERTDSEEEEEDARDLLDSSTLEPSIDQELRIDPMTNLFDQQPLL